MCKGPGKGIWRRARIKMNHAARAEKAKGSVSEMKLESRWGLGNSGP